VCGWHLVWGSVSLSAMHCFQDAVLPACIITLPLLRQLAATTCCDANSHASGMRHTRAAQMAASTYGQASVAAGTLLLVPAASVMPADTTRMHQVQLLLLLLLAALLPPWCYRAAAERDIAELIARRLSETSGSPLSADSVLTITFTGQRLQVRRRIPDTVHAFVHAVLACKPHTSH
jgi:hypothetical protein